MLRSDMKNARTFMDGQGSGFRVMQEVTSLWCGVGAFVQTMTREDHVRLVLREQQLEHWNEQPCLVKTWSWTRKREAPSRFETPVDPNQSRH